MEIKSLENTDLEIIVACMAESFKDYFVVIPSDVSFWERRYHAARVDFSLSFGAFENGELIGFIIHGIDKHEGLLAAFNTGTGVLEAHRGRKIVDKIYAFALPKLRAQGVQKCLLEVIEENHRAIRVYERIGFQKDRFLRCFNGEPSTSNLGTNLQKVKFTSLESRIREFQSFYSWDHSTAAIHKAGPTYETFLVLNDAAHEIGYLVINTSNKAFIQLEAFQDVHWPAVLESTKLLHPSLRINNIDNRKKACVDALIGAGIDNHINQYEMSMFI